MDGRLDVMKLMGGGGNPAGSAETLPADSPLNGAQSLGQASAPNGSAEQAPTAHSSPTGEPLVPGKNCYQVIGTFMPGPDGMRLMVTVDGSSLSPKQVLDHLKAMAASIVQQLQQTAKKIQVASDIPHSTPGGKRGKH